VKELFMVASIFLLALSTILGGQSSTFGPPRTKAEFDREAEQGLRKILDYLLPFNHDLQHELNARQQALVVLRQRVKERASEDLIRVSAKQLAAADTKVIEAELTLVQKQLPQDRVMPLPLTTRIMWLGREVCGGHLEVNPVLLLQVLQAADPEYRKLVEEMDRLEHNHSGCDRREVIERLHSTRKAAEQRRDAFLRRVLMRLNADPATDPILAKYASE
jgi:hypothetical protein